MEGDEKELEVFEGRTDRTVTKSSRSLQYDRNSHHNSQPVNQTGTFNIILYFMSKIKEIQYLVLTFGNTLQNPQTLFFYTLLIN